METLLSIPDRSFFAIKLKLLEPDLNDAMLNTKIDSEITSTKEKLQQTFLEPQSLLRWTQKTMTVRQDLIDKDYNLLKALKDSAHLEP
jgi:hypothetical protein